MPKVAVYNSKGESAGEMSLDDAVFAVEIDPALVQFVMNAQRANAHVPFAHTKGRKEIRGGGRKPWRQKGTGNARHGSIRSPLWRGGGVTFGPTNARNQAKKVNKKERRAALRMVLSDKVAEKAFIVVESLKDTEGKTKNLATVLQKLPAKEKSTLIAVNEKDAALTRAAQNIPKVNTVLADSLNVLDLLQYQYVVIDKAGVETLSSLLK